MKQLPFSNDQDFFKSHQLNDNGELLKTIPEMPQQSINNNSISSDVVQFKNKIESMFNEVDNVIKEIIEDLTEKCVKKYYEGKKYLENNKIKLILKKLYNFYTFGIVLIFAVEKLFAQKLIKTLITSIL